MSVILCCKHCGETRRVSDGGKYQSRPNEWRCESCAVKGMFSEPRDEITRLKEALSVAREALCSIAVPGALQTRDDWQMAFARKALASIDRIEGGSK